MQRISRTQQVAAARICQLELARGWSVWLSEYERRNRAVSLLRAASNRLVLPRQTHAFEHWRKDWEGSMRAAETRAQREAFAERQRQQRELEAQRSALKAEASQASINTSAYMCVGGLCTCISIHANLQVVRSSYRLCRRASICVRGLNVQQHVECAA